MGFLKVIHAMLMPTVNRKSFNISFVLHSAFGFVSCDIKHVIKQNLGALLYLMRSISDTAFVNVADVMV